MKLTPRQTELLELLCTGARDKEIADKMKIGIHGVRRHFENLFRKLGATERTGLAVLYTRLSMAGTPLAQRPSTQPRRNASK